MIIQWDMDGVLANFNQGYRMLLNDSYGLRLNVDEKPAFWDDLPEGVTPEMDKEVWKYIKASDDFWFSLRPLVTPDVLDRIACLNADQYFVTSRVGATAKGQTEDWLAHHAFGGASTYPSVIVSKRKSEAANALGATYAIDDKLGNVLQLYYNCPKTKVFCLDTPYNRLDPRLAGRGVRRVYSVTEFLDGIYTDPKQR